MHYDIGLACFAQDGFAAFRNAWWRVRAYGDAPLTAKLPDGSELQGIVTDVTSRGALVLASDWGLHTLVPGRYPYVLLVPDIGNTRDRSGLNSTMDRSAPVRSSGRAEHFVERAGFAARVPERAWSAAMRPITLVSKERAERQFAAPGRNLVQWWVAPGVRWRTQWLR